MFIGVALMSISMLSCHSVENQGGVAYERSKVAEMIANHDTTILYFMTSWCQAGQNSFENNLKPYLSKASDTKAIVVVSVGEIEQIVSLERADKNLLICMAPSRYPLLDKMFINKECKKLLSDYKRVNYVPVELVCNRKAEILNWNTDEALNRTYGFIYSYLMGWK